MKVRQQLAGSVEVNVVNWNVNSPEVCPDLVPFLLVLGVGDVAPQVLSPKCLKRLGKARHFGALFIGIEVAAQCLEHARLPTARETEVLQGAFRQLFLE